MIKEQNQPNVPTQVWTFNDAGNTFIIKKNSNLFNFKLCNTLTNQWHQSEDVELQRINEQTIKAAFDPKVESFSYELSQKSQKSINLQFRVKIEYLSSNFYQDIQLNEIQMDKQQEIKIKIEELITEAVKLQGLVQKQIQNKTLIHYLQSGSFNTTSGKMFTIHLGPGKYLFSATGAWISQKFYSGEYYDEGLEDCGFYNNTFPLRLNIETTDKQQFQFFSTVPHFYDCYEYPYSISGIFDLKKQNQVSFSYDGYNVNEPLMLNTNVLIVSPISQFNDKV